MKRNIFGVILILFLSGCAVSAGTGYSILTTIPPGNQPIPMTQGAKPVVAVGPIGVPGYILRASTVTESAWNITNVSTADQNAAVLAREIPRVVTVNMERLLTPKGLAVTSSGLGTDADYRIAVDLSAFDVTEFNTLKTAGQWALYQRGNNTPVVVKDISFSTPIADNNNSSVRAAMSRSLADLATMIAGDLDGFLGTR